MHHRAMTHSRTSFYRSRNYRIDIMFFSAFGGNPDTLSGSVGF